MNWRAGQMTKPIADKAEVALEYPDKFYSGTFERTSLFEATFDPSGVALILERSGPRETKKSAHIHMHYGLFADVLEQLAATVANIPKDIPARDHLANSFWCLQRALGGVDADRADSSHISLQRRGTK
jgi:hypothetical protein